ncbi:MAG: response regulator, partial [Saprospiraceae bacterium]|nr:response regulator [Saprospiraceae bacterium]
YFWKQVSEIYAYDPQRRETALRVAFPELAVQRKMDMVIEASGAFWLLGTGKAVQDGCLYRFNAAGRLVQEYLFPLHVYDYARLLAARDGSLWITGARCQLFRFDPVTGRFEEWNYGHLFGKQANAVLAVALAEDGNGNLWIGTQEGLVKARPRGAQLDVERMQADPHQPQGLNHNSVACLLPDPVDPGGILWVGTKGGGINRLDVRSGQFRHFTTADGLPDKVIYGILPGNEDPASGRVSLWCSTNRGLVKLSPRPDASAGFDITTFAAAQGLQDNEFNTQAFYKARGPGGRGGELLFGGVNGLNHFFPEAVQSDTTTPPVFVVGLQVNHQPVSDVGPRGEEALLPAPLEYLRELVLQHDQNNLSFEFSALDFTDPSKNRYRYRLVGLDPDWTEAGTHRFAHFTHLAPGRYTLLVQANNGEGRWQDVAQAIQLRVQPPWWRSGAAYLLYALLLLGAVWWAYRIQIRRVQLRGQLAFEHRETERVKAMEQMKTNFFSNVTHEFRTPLTLILEPVRRILAKTQDAEIRENARLVEANSQRLLGLVNQLLDMAKLENDPEHAVGLDLRRADFGEMLREVFRSFLPLAEQRDIRLGLKIPEPVPPFLFDQNKTERVLHNLIANALKFTPAGGSVELLLRREDAIAASAAPVVVVAVRDTGIGIPADALEKVFERFYQVDGSSTRAGEGTGIGLALSKELALQMGGGLSVSSEAGKGSEFSLWLPVVEGAAVAAPERETERPVRGPVYREEGRPSVLLIEDNAELRGFIKQCLAPAWDVLEASNGAEGVQKAAELVPDLVISDVMMPLKDGFAVCDELKNGELTAHIPVILLSAKSAMDSKLKGLRSGADDYLAKPFNTDELLARMENLLLLRRRLRERYARAAPASPEPAAEFLTPPDREFLRRFTVTLEQHLPDETIGVDDFAQKMAISRVQLHRKLKALTDRNVSDFVRDYRLDRAMAMLQNREGLVYEVASKVGFGSEKYFSRAFKEKFGVPPSQVSQG